MGGQKDVRTMTTGPRSPTAVFMSSDYYKRNAMARGKAAVAKVVIEKPVEKPVEKIAETTVEEQQEKLVAVLDKEKEVLEKAEASSTTEEVKGEVKAEEVKEDSIFPGNEAKKEEKEVVYYQRPGAKDREKIAEMTAAMVKEEEERQAAAKVLRDERAAEKVI